MTKIRLALAAASLAVVSLGASTPAQSSTCEISEPGLDDVVCGVVTTVGPFLAPLCEGKLEICLA